MCLKGTLPHACYRFVTMGSSSCPFWPGGVGRCEERVERSTRRRRSSPKAGYPTIVFSLIGAGRGARDLDASAYRITQRADSPIGVHAAPDTRNPTRGYNWTIVSPVLPFASILDSILADGGAFQESHADQVRRSVNGRTRVLHSHHPYSRLSASNDAILRRTFDSRFL